MLPHGCHEFRLYLAFVLTGLLLSLLMKRLVQLNPNLVSLTTQLRFDHFWLQFRTLSSSKILLGSHNLESERRSTDSETPKVDGHVQCCATTDTLWLRSGTFVALTCSIFLPRADQSLLVLLKPFDVMSALSRAVMQHLLSLSWLSGPRQGFRLSKPIKLSMGLGPRSLRIVNELACIW